VGESVSGRVLKGAIRCLRNRAAKIYDTDDQQEEIRHLHNTFRANGFPTKTKPILEDPKYQKRTTPVEQSPDEIGPEDSGPKQTLCLPYVKGLSEKIDSVYTTIKSVEIRTVFKTDEPR